MLRQIRGGAMELVLHAGSDVNALKRFASVHPASARLSRTDLGQIRSGGTTGKRARRLLRSRGDSVISRRKAGDVIPELSLSQIRIGTSTSAIR